MMVKRSLINFAAGLAILWMVDDASASYITIPYDADLYMKFVGGEASGITEVGIATSRDIYIPYFTNLPNSSNTNTEVFAGTFMAGTGIDFYLKTEWSGTYWAFSNNEDIASLVAFTDIDNSLTLNGSTLKKTSDNTWLLYLDDAASYQVDDDDNDVLMQIRLSATPVSPKPETVPEPSIMLLVGSGLLCLLSGVKKKK